MKTPVIYCFPFAGGNSYSYQYIEKFLPSFILRPVELPGRGKRSREALVSDLIKMADDCFLHINGGADHFIFWGHSMGALLAFLVTRKLATAEGALPSRLILSGCGSPESISSRDKVSHLPKDAFLKEVFRLGGIPETAQHDEVILSYIEPILRSDIAAVEKFISVGPEPLNVPITVLYGDKEDITEEDVNRWEAHSKYKLTVHQIPGNHFFIYDDPQRIATIIGREANQSPLPLTQDMN